MEQILTVPTQQVMERVPMGLVKVDEAQMLEFIERQGKFYDRTDALENDKRFKQIVAYVLVECQGKLLSYQRKNSTDPRIEKKHSLAFGGHVNTEDVAAGQNPVLLGRARELREEVTLHATPSFEFFGTLNILKAPIDEFHLGMVYLARVPTPGYDLNEVDKYMWSGWITPQEAFGKFDKLESWSQEVVRTLYPALTTAKT